jgi:hypothetical protein
VFLLLKGNFPDLDLDSVPPTVVTLAIPFKNVSTLLLGSNPSLPDFLLGFPPTAIAVLPGLELVVPSTIDYKRELISFKKSVR